MYICYSLLYIDKYFFDIHLAREVTSNELFRWEKIAPWQRRKKKVPGGGGMEWGGGGWELIMCVLYRNVGNESFAGWV